MDDKIGFFPFENLLKAEFVVRENRFRAEVLLDGEPVKVHVPNSGRMRELLYPGAEVWIKAADNPARKTAYTLFLVKKEDTFICLYASLANNLIEFWMREGLLAGFRQAKDIQREKTYGKSRFDFKLKREDRICFAEVKSVNLVENNTARFPDAPTERGSKHLKELICVRENGMDAAVLFLVMGNKATDFEANTDTDPAFAKNLKKAEENGVELYIHTCEVRLEGVYYRGMIPMRGEN